jgi:lipopolysaccharide biosynthesis protein
MRVEALKSQSTFAYSKGVAVDDERIRTDRTTTLALHVNFNQPQQLQQGSVRDHFIEAVAKLTDYNKQVGLKSALLVHSVSLQWVNQEPTSIAPWTEACLRIIFINVLAPPFHIVSGRCVHEPELLLRQFF